MNSFVGGFGPIGEKLDGGAVLPALTAEQITARTQQARENMAFRNPAFFRQEVELSLPPIE